MDGCRLWLAVPEASPAVRIVEFPIQFRLWDARLTILHFVTFHIIARLAQNSH